MRCRLLQERIWGSTLELVLYLTNISSKDNLHNLTCEAENQAGPGEEMVQLDIECKCLQNKNHTLESSHVQYKSSGLMEVRARAHRGHFSSAVRVDSQRKEKCTALISSKCPLYKSEYVPTMLLMELFVICHSRWRLVRSVKII